MNREGMCHFPDLQGVDGNDRPAIGGFLVDSRVEGLRVALFNLTLTVKARGDSAQAVARCAPPHRSGLPQRRSARRGSRAVCAAGGGAPGPVRQQRGLAHPGLSHHHHRWAVTRRVRIQALQRLPAARHWPLVLERAPRLHRSHQSSCPGTSRSALVPAT